MKESSIDYQGVDIIQLALYRFLLQCENVKNKNYEFCGSGKENLKVSKLARVEQETIILFNVAEPNAIVYTRDKAVMRRVDALFVEFPEIYKCINVA